MFARDEPVRMTAPRPAAQFGVDIPPELLTLITGSGSIAPRISRAEALQVPAVLRARNLICGSVATLPIRVHAPDRRVDSGQWLVPQPDPNIASSVTMAYTIEDLLFESVAWWRVTRFGPRDFPAEAVHVPHESVHVAPAGALMPSQAQISSDQPFPVDGQVFIDGIPVPDREIIRYDSLNPPLLRHAARAIRICLLLDTTASLYAKDPLPLGYFAPREGADPATDDEIQKVLDEWELARQKRATGYVNAALTLNTVQWSPEQLQLAAARQHAVLEIARATGLDPEDLGVSTTSRTYQNGEQRRQALLDFVLGPYVSAIQDRLSMRDVLPRDFVARIDFGGFLRGDTLTRMQTYEVGQRVGAYTEDEVRDLENRPRLTPAQRARADQIAGRAANGGTGREAPAMQGKPELKLVDSAAFEADDAVRVHFDDAEAAETFRVNVEKRTISGLAVPWGKVARSGFSKWRFGEGSLRWSSEARVKLNLHHDFREIIGHAIRLQSTSRGLDVTFKVGDGPEEDRALRKAKDKSLDGFSIEVDFVDEFGDDWQPDPSDESVRLVRQATLRGVALTGMPAFDDARVASVAATRNGRKGTMPEDNKPDGGQGTVTLQADEFTNFMSGLADKVAESHKNLTEQLTESLGESFAAGMKAALENIHDPQRDGPEPVRAARFTVTREAPVYTFDGAGPSMVRDAWYAQREHDSDAQERIRRFHQQSAEIQKLAATHVAFQAGQKMQFATVTTGTASQIIPPGYRPDLFVPQLAQDRPLVNALSRGTIANATPFVVPIFGSATAMTGDHTEGLPPGEGTLAFATKTVTPGAVSGKLPLSREIVDSSNPAIDQIALASMRESYAQQTEAKVYTLLNGVNGAGGAIDGNGFVPSGAQAATVGVGVANANPEKLVYALRLALAKYPFRRFASPTMALLGQNATGLLADAKDTVGRPLLPSVGAQNASGLGNAVTQGWFIDGLAHVPAWAMSGVAAGDSQVFTLAQADAWAWESPVLAFRFEEKQGPEIIELALFGYFATHLLRPVGLSGMRITAT